MSTERPSISSGITRGSNYSTEKVRPAGREREKSRAPFAELRNRENHVSHRLVARGLASTPSPISFSSILFRPRTELATIGIRDEVRGSRSKRNKIDRARLAFIKLLFPPLLPSFRNDKPRMLPQPFASSQIETVASTNRLGA